MLGVVEGDDNILVGAVKVEVGNGEGGLAVGGAPHFLICPELSGQRICG
jgi:hypothetical protein